MDNVAVRDSASPSGWRMRSSHRAGVAAYEQALDLLPSAYAGYEHEKFDGLRRLLSIRTGLWFARAAAPDTGRFWGRIALLNDTLAMVPYPWSVVALGGPGSIPPGFVEAQASRISYFRKLATGWSSAFPNRAGPKHAMALALEMSGDPHAIDTLRLAERLATDTVRKVQLAAAEILLRVKFGSNADAAWWRGVWKSADSLLRNFRPSEVHAQALTPLAALLGRCDDAVSWSRFRTRETLPSLSQGLVDAADLHVVRVSLGCSPGPTVPSLGALVDLVAQDTRGLGAETRTFVTAMVLQRPTTLAWPIDSNAVERVAAQSSDLLIHAARSLARGDHSSAREIMTRFELQYVEAVGTSPDVGYPAARMYLALGDTARGILQLDRSLSGLRENNPGTLNDPVVAATLVRCMALRADLAQARGEQGIARQWGGIVSVLWSSADREPASAVRRLSR
jgi:hypothetical protein